MANIKQAKKRVKQADKNRLHNASRRSEMRTYIKKVIKSVAEKNLEAALGNFKLAASMLDKLAAKNIIHPNKAARHKSRLNKKLRELA